MLRWLLLSFLTHCTLEPSKFIDLSYQTPSCVTDSCMNLGCPRVSAPGWIPLSSPTGEKFVYRESFGLRDVGGEGGELPSGKFSEYVGIINPASKGFLYCVYIL